MTRTRTIETYVSKPHNAGTLDSAISLFLQHQRRQVSDAHLWHLYRTLAQLSQSLGNPPVATITPAHLQQHVTMLQTRYSPGTIRPIVGDIRQFFRFCRKKSLIRTNPAKKLQKPRYQPTRDKAAPEAACRHLLQHLAQQLPIYRDLFHQLHTDATGWNYFQLKALHDLVLLTLLYESGCRAGEAAGISTAALDQATAQRLPAYTVPAYGKTGVRYLRFTEATAELWRFWRSQQPHQTTYAFWSWRKGSEPRPLTTHTLSQMLARRCEQAGVPAFRAHALRHAKVKRSRRLVGLLMAQKLVDHSSLAMTQSYANVDAEEITEATQLTGLDTDLWQR